MANGRLVEICWNHQCENCFQNMESDIFNLIVGIKSSFRTPKPIDNMNVYWLNEHDEDDLHLCPSYLFYRVYGLCDQERRFEIYFLLLIMSGNHFLELFQWDFDSELILLHFIHSFLLNLFFYVFLLILIIYVVKSFQDLFQI